MMCHTDLSAAMPRLALRVTVLTALLLAMLLLAAPSAHAQEGVVLVQDGQPRARLYVSQPLDVPELAPAEAQALTDEQRDARAEQQLLADAVADFLDHLERMSGGRLEVVVGDDPAAVQAPAIVVGDLAVRLGAAPQHQTPMRESYRLLTRDGRLLVGGEGALGYSHGLYTVLYHLGCDWIMPGPEGEVIPRQATVTIPPLDEAKQPAYEVRAPWYSGGVNIIQAEEYQQLEQWKQRQRQTPSSLRQRHSLFLEGGHFWDGFIHLHRAELEANPEMRALVRQPDGTLTRGWAQLEPTHPRVIELTVEWVKDQYERNGWPKDKPVALSIGPNDGGGYSVSAEALAAGADRHDPITGDRDQTDVLVLYTNQVLERLVDEYPHVRLGWYIYSVHADFPQRYTPHPNFVGNFADITYSRYHSTLDPRSHTRRYFRGIVEQWGGLAREQDIPLWFYGYNWNLAENMMPYSKMKIWGQDLPWYHQQGIRGHNNEQDKAWSILGPHNYLMARLGWDVELDWREVLREYAAKAFGEGGPEMEAYYLDLIETQEKGGHEAGGYWATHLIFDRDFITRSRERFERAGAAAATDVHRRNVDSFGQAVTALEIYLDYREATTRFDFVEAQRQYQRMIEHWQGYLDRNPNLVSRYARVYLDWLFKPYVEQGVRYSTGEYRIVHAIPDELPTMFDPNTAGQFMGFYEPTKPDEHLARTQTWGSTWDAQGLWPLREGAAWYRVWFDLDEHADAEGIGLFLGAFEDAVHVWCNGQYVGNARGYVNPAAFDLTDFVKRGERNLVALQVIRHGKLNEINHGGLLYPSFIFAGPRLEQVAPAVEPMQRILPGGAREDVPQ